MWTVRTIRRDRWPKPWNLLLIWYHSPARWEAGKLPDGHQSCCGFSIERSSVQDLQGTLRSYTVSHIWLRNKHISVCTDCVSVQVSSSPPCKQRQGEEDKEISLPVNSEGFCRTCCQSEEFWGIDNTARFREIWRRDWGGASLTHSSWARTLW